MELVRREQAETVELLQARLKPSRRVAQVVDVWLPQYEELRTRYKFLVLNGESRFGKSVFAENIAGSSKPSRWTWPLQSTLT